jgi:hypothetical protein
MLVRWRCKMDGNASVDVQPVLVPVSCPDPDACFLYSSAESCSSDAICDVNTLCEGSTSDTEGTLQGGEGRGAISVGGCVTPGSDCTSLNFKFNPVVMMDIPARVFVKVHYFHHFYFYEYPLARTMLHICLDLCAFWIAFSRRLAFPRWLSAPI